MRHFEDFTAEFHEDVETSFGPTLERAVFSIAHNFLWIERRDLLLEEISELVREESYDLAKEIAQKRHSMYLHNSKDIGQSLKKTEQILNRIKSEPNETFEEMRKFFGWADHDLEPLLKQLN